MSRPAFDPGAVRLSLRWAEGRVRDVRLHVGRPTAASALRGRPADEAVRLLPLLYSICGAAQGIAAALALRAARGEARPPSIDAAVLAEARREHLFRLLLDWPRALGLPRREALLAEGAQRLRGDDFAAWAETGLRDPMADVARALATLPEPPSAAAPRLLPPLTAAETLALWPRLDAGFGAAPTYLGHPAETGALARRPELGVPPVLGRVRARAADLMQPGALGRTSAATVASGIGRATVETARGLLMHEIALDGERVADYVIVAPTEWNFHAEGIIGPWLEGVPVATTAAAKALAERAILALDPCVRWEVELAGGV